MGTITVEKKEGTVRLKIPDPSTFRAKSGDYVPSLTKVFYNPWMEFCRDISVSVAQVLSGEVAPVVVCDPLAGVGIRGLRYAKEVRGVEKVVVNDRSRSAAEFIQYNAELNGLDNLEIYKEDANALLWRFRGAFHLVDIDPFGSPVPFLDAACASLRKEGILAMTATDTAPLSGVHPRACFRRYGAKSLRTEYCHESGIRILIGFSQRVGAVHGLALIPLFAHATRHYFRVYLKAERGTKKVDEVIEKLGYISHCFSCRCGVVTPGLVKELPKICECGGRLEHAGPMWLGRLGDKTFLSRLRDDLGRRDFGLKADEISLVTRCMEEADGPPSFHDVNELAGRAGINAPKMGEFLTKLRDRGYFASRTHFSATGVRTDAPMEELLRIFKEMDHERA